MDEAESMVILIFDFLILGSATNVQVARAWHGMACNGIGAVHISLLIRRTWLQRVQRNDLQESTVRARVRLANPEGLCFGFFLTHCVFLLLFSKLAIIDFLLYFVCLSLFHVWDGTAIIDLLLLRLSRKL